MRINRAGNIFEGPLLELKVEAFEGFFNQPRYRFLRNDAYGEAERVDFIDDKRAIIRNATYTTCQRKPGPSWMPDWILRAASIQHRPARKKSGVASGARAELHGRADPAGARRSASRCRDKRKSGLLPPTIGLDNLNGVELTLPYYWNIAPNRDATLYPTLMTKRGVDLGGEFRYLERDYSGSCAPTTCPTTSCATATAGAIALQHAQALSAPACRSARSGLNLNLNRVSDDNYWRDFSRSTALAHAAPAGQRRRAVLGRAAISRCTARALKWQTLQDVTAPIVPPYDRAAAARRRATARNNLAGGLDAYVETDYTRSQSDPRAHRPAQRAARLRAGAAQPALAGAGLVRHAQAAAARDAVPVRRARWPTARASASRTVPTFSLDSGLVFERDASYFGRAFRQTLEPRAFYVYTPFRDQSLLPNYDSARNDFNFATIYTENAFGGNDRISDNNLLTLGATTRLLDPDTGAEAARFGIAQRLRFKDQLVTLPGGTPVSERAVATCCSAPRSTGRRNGASTPRCSTTPRPSARSAPPIGGRYSPGNYRVVSAAYRLQRGHPSEQIDVGWQWPLNDLWGDKGQDLGPGRGEGEGRWYSVGRLNFSLKDQRLVDAVVGLEYDAGCWLGRVVFERLQSGTDHVQQAHPVPARIRRLHPPGLQRAAAR